MTSKQIKRRIETLSKRAKKSNNEILDLRLICTHEDYTSVYRANLGNYDPSNDVYWLEFTCNICGHYQTYYSNTPEYRMFAPKNKA